jgi:SAM-dependent methyltransferase
VAESEAAPSGFLPERRSAYGPGSFLARNKNVHSKSPSSPFRYVATGIERAVQELAAPLPAHTGDVLDYGCATGPYRHLFSGTGRYMGADLAGNPEADLVLNPDGSLPVDDSSFDIVLSTQVLEHVPDPLAYLCECRRALRPGGALVLTTHGIMYYHLDPTDYWRWTGDGLALLLTQAGLRVDHQVGVLNLASTALQLFQDATANYLHRRLQKPYIAVMQQAVALADRKASNYGRLSNAMVIGARAYRDA